MFATRSDTRQSCPSARAAASGRLQGSSLDRDRHSPIPARAHYIVLTSCPGRRSADTSRTPSRSPASRRSRSSRGSTSTRATGRRGGRGLLRGCRADRPGGRLPGTALGGAVGVRDGRGPARRRLMIGTAVVLLWATGRLPLVAALVVLGRDLALVLGYKLLAPRGLELEVSFLGKLATWSCTRPLLRRRHGRHGVAARPRLDRRRAGDRGCASVRRPRARARRTVTAGTGGTSSAAAKECEVSS